MNQKKISESDKIIIKGFQTNNENQNLATLKEAMINGKPLYIPFIVDLYRETEHNSVKSEVLKLLRQLKQKETIPYLINSILDLKNKNIKKELTETCWQNGLNYAQYLEVFIDLIIQENFEIAFEAFTVIENLEYLPSDEIINKQLEKINQFLPEADKEKKYLLEETVKILASL